VIRLRAAGGAVFVPLRVSPGASRQGPGGEHGGRLRVYVQAPPERGRANEATCRVLAAALGMKPRDVSIASGAAGRDKEARIDGVDAKTVADKLTAMGIEAG
jgi:uncharacterized protein